MFVAIVYYLSFDDLNNLMFFNKKFQAIKSIGKLHLRG